jgi:hypothetical protein
VYLCIILCIFKNIPNGAKPPEKLQIQAKLMHIKQNIFPEVERYSQKVEVNKYS